MELLQATKLQFNAECALGSTSAICNLATARSGNSLLVVRTQVAQSLGTAIVGAGRFYGNFANENRTQCAMGHSRRQVSSRRVRGKAFAEAEPEVEIVQDEEWEKRMREETAERDRLRKEGKDHEWRKDEGLRNVIKDFSGYPKEEVLAARKLVTEFIKAGETVEEMIEEAGDNNELTPLALLVIKNRLDVARYDDERHVIQALDLLYRRVETEMLKRQAPLSLRLLNELLNLHDGFSREEWLQRSRRTMLKIFPPEDAFTLLAPQGFDIFKHKGPIEMPEEKEEDLLLRIDFIRDVTDLLKELEAQPNKVPVQGLDVDSVAMRFRQEERLRAIEQIKDLRNLAINLKW